MCVCVREETMPTLQHSIHTSSSDSLLHSCRFSHWPARPSGHLTCRVPHWPKLQESQEPVQSDQDQAVCVLALKRKQYIIGLFLIFLYIYFTFMNFDKLTRKDPFYIQIISVVIIVSNWLSVKKCHFGLQFLFFLFIKFLKRLRQLCSDCFWLLDQIVPLHCRCTCPSLVAHVMKSVFVGFHFPLCSAWIRLGPGRHLFFVLLSFGLGVLVSLEVFWTTSLLQAEPKWNSTGFGTTERARAIAELRGAFTGTAHREPIIVCEVTVWWNASACCTIDFFLSLFFFYVSHALVH